MYYQHQNWSFGTKYIVLLLLVGVSWPLAAATVKARLNYTNPLPRVESVRLENLAGNVQVRAGESFRVTAIIVAEGTDRSAADALAETVGLAAFQSGGTFNVQVQYPVERYHSFRYIPSPINEQDDNGLRTRCFLSVCINRLLVQYQGQEVYLYRGTDRGIPLHVDLDVQIPPGLKVKLVNCLGYIDVEGLKNDLNIETVNGGVTVSDLTGNLGVEGGAADFYAKNVTGNIQAVTTSGDVHLSGLHGELMTTKTDTGGVYAKSVTGSFQIKTESGEVHISGLQGNFVAHTESGDIFAQSISGAFRANTYSGEVQVWDSSDSNLFVRTGSGDVRFNDVKGSMNLNTGSGDIVLRGANGSLRAYTTSGKVAAYSYVAGNNVFVNTNGGNVLLDGDATAIRKLSIHTNSGGVLLLFPGTLSMQLDATSIDGLIRVRFANMPNEIERHRFFSTDFGRGQGRGTISTHQGNIGISG